MKQLVIFFLFFGLKFSSLAQSNNVGIGTTMPNASSVLEISSPDRGILIPRMVSSQREMIASPVQGLLVFDISTNSFWYYTSEWIEIAQSGSGDNLGNHIATQDLDMDGQRITNLDDPTDDTDAASKFYVDLHQDSDADAQNEIQNLAISNDTIFLESGGFVKLPASSGVFENDNGVVRNTGNINDDFVFGASALPPNGNNVSGRLLIFDENKAAFRVGRLNSSNAWAEDSLGIQSIGMGFNVKATGLNSFVMGSNSEALNEDAIAIGNSTEASGESSISIGSFNHTNGSSSVALGTSTIANGSNSLTTGRSTRADGNDATAMGYNTGADGDYSMAIGYITEATGSRSFATGSLSKAVGDYSSTFGLGTRSNAYGSVSIGRYNTGQGISTLWVASDPVFEVGIGLNSLNRMNAMTILKNGTVSFKEYAFPNVDGSANQVLQTDGNGQINWVTVTGNGDSDSSNELNSNLNFNSNQLSLTDAGGTLSTDLSGLIPQRIEDNDGDTRISFNNNADRILLISDGVSIAKMETDSMILLGKLQISSNTQSKIYLGQTFSQIGTTNNFVLKNQMNNTNDFVLNNQGEIGIGIDNPTEILDISAPNNFDGMRIRGSNNNHNVQLKMENNTAEGHEYTLRSTGVNSSQGGGKFLIRDNTEGNTRITIDSTGKVGIGKLDPDEKLHVGGDLKVDGLSGTGSTNVVVDSDGKLSRGGAADSKTIYIDFMDFEPQLSGELIYYHMLEGTYLEDGAGTIVGSMRDVPDGATVTSVKIYYMDLLTNSGDDMDFQILYHDGGSTSPVQIHDIGDSINGTGAKQSSTYNNLNIPIDRSIYHYSFGINSSDWGTSMKVFSVEITYTP